MWTHDSSQDGRILRSGVRQVSINRNLSPTRRRFRGAPFAAWPAGVVLSLLVAGQLFAAPIPGLFNTGVGATSNLLAGGSVDPHFRLIQSADASVPGPNAIVMNDGWPIASGVWLANGPASKWISPLASQATGNLPGNYVYRLTFTLTGLDPDSAVITGRWTSDNGATDILINGASTGINYDGNFGAFSGNWTLNSGFIDGTNTLDFVINNAGTTVNPTGFRAELSGTAEPPIPPGTPPTITAHPQSATVALQDPVSFSVKATGSRPFFYQWRRAGGPIIGATNASFSISSVSASDSGPYDVVVSNDAGSATSTAATLTTIFSPPAQPAYEPIGPPRRRSGLAFSEIMYHPRDRTDGRIVEFIELFNSNPWPEDLAGWKLAGDVDFIFPGGTSIAAQGFLVVAPVPADVEATHGITGVLGGFTNSLPNGGGTVRLVKRSGAIVLEVTYSDQPPWPTAADGTGHSLVLARPSFGEQNPKAWAASAYMNGSPGGPEPVAAAPQDYVVINEVFAHSDPPLVDFIELHNYSPFTADLSGCWLTDERNTNKFRIPNGTVLAPQGFVVLDETQLGFGLSSAGETAYLVNSNQTRVIDVVRFGGQAQGVSLGRYPDGLPTFSALSLRTPGTNNAPALLPPVVFNEILFNPISGNSEDEYVELFNRGTNVLDIGGWRLTDGIDFAFPKPTVMAPGQYLVVANNVAHLRTNYPGLTAANCLGNYGGTLANGGERIALERPDMSVTTNTSGVWVTNTFRVVVNEVSYFDKSRWSRFADGGGSSLELTDPHADTRSPANWADSDESAKGAWTAIEFTGTNDNAMPGVSADQVQLFLLGEGEALVDNVEVVYGGVNRVSNGTFESGTGGWTFQGTQIRSSAESTSGYNSARSLHLRASDRGEPIGNRVRGPLTAAIPAGSAVTLRARVRWLAGVPEFLMRLRGGGLEATARLTIAPNLGTPGAPNSRARANAGPAISDVTHRPVLPPANQPIRVVARVSDPDGVPGVTLQYRLDPSAALTAITMRDDGTTGDLLAGDGVFTGTIPGQPANTLIAFRIEAVDAAGVSATSVFPADAPARECLVRVGDQFIAGPFANYRIWMTQATLDTWSTRGNLSNDPLDVTYVYGNTRVVYNAASLYGGSPAWSPGFNSPVGNLCAYDILLPGDDEVLGDDKLGLDIPIRDATNQREQLMHWIADRYNLPNLYRRDVYMFVNGVRRGSVYHDTQQPGGDLIDEWFHDDPDGKLIKTTQWSEGTDAGSPEQILINSLERFTSSGTLKTARYRWNWRARADDSQLDDSGLLALVEAMNAPSNAYQSAVEGLVNVEDWMRMFAMNDLCSYWDGFGNPNAKNTFLYQTQDTGWRLIPWDFDVGLGVFNDPVNDALFPSNVDPTVRRMYAWPAFVRGYWRELEFGMNNILPSSTVTSILTAKDNAYRAAGLSFASPFVASGAYGLSIPEWMFQRRGFLQTQLASVAATFALTTPTNINTSSNLLVLSGRAPVSVQTITINGIEYPITWTTVSNWTIRVPLVAGDNQLLLAGFDRNGNAASNSTYTINATFTGSVAPSGQSVVLNEILFHPLVPDAEYVELFNTHSSFTFDLSAWRVNGLDYTFPPGSFLGPRSFLVLVKDPSAFLSAYGSTIPLFGKYNGNLQFDGETLTLEQPVTVVTNNTTNTLYLAVDKVRYEAVRPWPTGTNDLITASSIQLIDPTQDNSRPCNWGTRYVPAVWSTATNITGSTNGGWRFVSLTNVTGTTTTLQSNLIYLSAAGDVYLDDLRLVDTNNPSVNLLSNGDFEGPFSTSEGGPWAFVGTVGTNSHLAHDVVHSGTGSLHVVFTGQGGGPGYITQQMIVPAPTNGHILSYWYYATRDPNTLTVRLRPGIGLNSATNVQIFVVPDRYVPPQLITPAVVSLTPGRANTGTSNLVPAIPPLWLNEVQPVNLNGLADHTGAHEPWIELFNAGSNAVSLEGLHLSDNYTNLGQWAFPAGAAIAPGEFKILFADGQPAQTTPTEWHTSFRLAPAGGAVVLSRGAQVLDYLNYTHCPPGHSHGDYPDAQPFYRQEFSLATPGAPNDNTAPPLVAFINEWMAGNTGFIQNPVDGNNDDWFELFNPGATPANLGGLFFTDNLANPTQFQIPDNGHYVIPPGGFLLVWANNQPAYNSTNRADLFVSFQLARDGEAIGLYASDGTLIDAISFGPQTNNISEGRYPDGASSRYFMPAPTPRAPNALPFPAQAPQLGHIEMLPGNVVSFALSTVPGHVYRVEYRDDLGAGTWLPLLPDLTATSNSIIITDNPGENAQRFYRTLLLP